MLTIAYLDHNTGEKRVIGPSTHFRLIGPSLRMGLQDEEVARYHHHFGCWYVGDSVADIISIEGIDVSFANPDGRHSQKYGPYDYIRLLGNVMRQRRATDAAVAKLEPDIEMWRVVDNDTLWAEMSLMPTSKAKVVLDPVRMKLYTPSDRRRRTDLRPV
jgi:hypothetical protein